MSYILDALKKSDQKRKVGNVPGLQADHRVLVNVEKRRRMAPLFGGIILCVVLVNGGLWLWWAKPWQTAAGNKDETPFASVESAPPRQAIPAPSRPVRLPATGAAVATSPVTLGSEPARISPAVPWQPSDNPVRVAPSLPSSGGRPTAGGEAEAIEPMVPAVPQPRARIISPAPVHGSDDDFDESAGSPLPEAQDVSALPEHIQAALPQINISLHFYSNEPRARLARINGRHLHEGDVVANDLRLLEITADGAIFSFRGYRFRMDKF